MAIAQQQVNKQAGAKNLDFGELGIALLVHWYWIVIAAAVALAIAVLFILRTTPTYTRSCSLLIKVDDKGNSGGSLPKELQDLGVSGSNVNINNEIQTIKAPVLVQEAVKRLHLDVQMNVEEGLRMKPLYDNAPIRLFFPQTADNATCAFKMKLNRNRTAELWNFISPNGTEDGRRITVKMGELARTPVGMVLIQPTNDFARNFTDKEISVSKFSVKAVGNAYAARLGVVLADEESSILDITLSDASRKRADDLIYKIIDVYNEQWLEDKNSAAESTSDFITDRLNTLAKELGDVDQQISDYKSSSLLPDVDAASSLYMSESAKNGDQILQLNTQLSMARYIRQYLADRSKQGQYLPTNTGIGSTGIEVMISEYNKAVGARNEILENSSENTPFVQKADNDLAKQKATILHSLDNLIAQLQAQISSWEKNENKTNKKLATAPKQVKQLLSIGRQQKVKETLYIYLLQKREENNLTKTFTAWNTRIIQPPTGSTTPSAPKRNEILLIALGIGVLIPVAWIYLREATNTRVRGRADLDGMKTPLIGEIPNISVKEHWWERTKRDVSRQVYVKENSRDLFNESFRVLRTKLDYYMQSLGSGQKVVMVTSFNPSSGKSFICANLGKVISLKAQRVLVVDMDFRRCSLSALINKPKHGTSDYLAGITEDWEQLIHHDSFGGGVDVLPVGTIPPNPTEVMLSPKLETLLSRFREVYDYIILDCPPIDVVADTNIIKKYSDVSLFVVRAGLMDRRLLKDVDELYTAQTYKHMALLLNGTAFVSSRYGNYRYGYGYGYGYGYSYHYGYGGGKHHRK